MSAKKRRKFSAEEKAKVALDALRGELTLAELSSKWGVHANQVSTWKQAAIAGLASVFSGKQERVSDDNASQIKELHAKIGELTIERDFLEKVSRRIK